MQGIRPELHRPQLFNPNPLYEEWIAKTLFSSPHYLLLLWPMLRCWLKTAKEMWETLDFNNNCCKSENGSSISIHQQELPSETIDQYIYHIKEIHMFLFITSTIAKVDTSSLANLTILWTKTKLRTLFMLCAICVVILQDDQLTK